MDREARKAMAHGVAKESQLSSWAQQADIRVLGKAAVLIGAWGLPSSVELMAAVTPSRSMSAISGYLLAVSQGLSSVPGGPSRFLAVWPPRSVHRVDLFVFFPTNQGVSLRLPPVTPDSPPDSCSRGHHLPHSGPRQGNQGRDSPSYPQALPSPGKQPSWGASWSSAHCPGQGGSRPLWGSLEGLTAEVWLHSAESIVNATDLYVLKWLKWQVILLFYHNFS